MPDQYSILVVDDHPLIRSGLSSFIKAMNLSKEVYEAMNGKEALELLQQKAVQVVMLDVRMPVMDGYQTAKQIISKYPMTSIIMLSTYDNKFVLNAFLKLGVDGFITKNDTAIDTAIRSVMNGEIYISPELRGFDSSEYELPELKPREAELMELLAKGNTTVEISGILGITPSTVETYRKDILKKFQVHNTVELVDLMHRIGKL